MSQFWQNLQAKIAARGAEGEDVGPGRNGLTTYGRSFGFLSTGGKEAVSPTISTRLGILSFGTAAAIRLQVLPELGHLQVAATWYASPMAASPEQLARAALEHGCRSVALPTMTR